ncbi:putative haloalkane dehalogenase [Helianthus debilis subsp. tardiflorus]
MAAGRVLLEKLWRIVRTVYVVAVMVTSLLVLSLPVLVAIGDVLVPCVLISRLMCVRCYSFEEHMARYSFRSSFMDVPVVSVIRSLIITCMCVYMICDGSLLSHGQYLGTVALCSALSVLILSVKVCIFTVNSQLETEPSSSPSRQRLHFKKSWGMPVLFLSSVVFALGHMIIAYRASCRARRKLMLHRIDPESVLSSKNLFTSVYAKVPRSPTPAVRAPKSESEIRRKPVGQVQVRTDGELPVRFLADVDSLFMGCQGVTLHYKISMPSPPSRTLSSTLLERPLLNVISKTQYQRHRSFSNVILKTQYHTSPLHSPLLDGINSGDVLSQEIPVFSLDEENDENVTMKPVSHSLERVSEVNGQFGIVLVHGFGGGVFSWRHVMGELARNVKCIVAAFDRPGWGLTSRTKRDEWESNNLPNPYMLDAQVDMLLSFCKEMGFSSVVLVGHDDGGLLALKAAQRAKESPSLDVEIKGVVLLTTNLSREVVPGFARILMRTSLGKKHMVRPLLRTEISQVVNRRAWYDATKLTMDVLSLYKAPLCVEGWDESLHEIGRLSSETILTQQNESLLVKAVHDTPLLVIAGAEDALVPLKSVQAMASKFVNSRLVAISGCGHLPHEECPKALLAAVLPFISKLLVSVNSENE